MKKTPRKVIRRKPAPRKSIKEKSEKPASQEVQRLIHELNNHQAELEAQNEELRTAQTALGKSSQQYVDLYDFAPIGYFSFDQNGLIENCNLTGASLLGFEREILIKKPFWLYVAPGYEDVFRAHLRSVFQVPSRQTCEIR